MKINKIITLTLTICGFYSCSTNSTEKVKTISLGDTSFNMILVEGGVYTMGPTANQQEDAYTNKSPAKIVKVESFYMGESEVTQELWTRVMGDSVDTYLRMANKDYRSFGKSPKMPMYAISFNDCIEFISKLNILTGLKFRIPTEAEWEFAARGGNHSKGHKYSGSDIIGNVCWFIKNSKEGNVHEVMTKEPNELGLYDMSGNVLEFCHDSMKITLETTKTYRIIKGGSIYSYAEGCKSYWRDKREEGHRDYDQGLRLVLDVNP